MKTLQIETTHPRELLDKAYSLSALFGFFTMFTEGGVTTILTDNPRNLLTMGFTMGTIVLADKLKEEQLGH